MASNLLINAMDIQQWADRLDARSQLPRLVRRLIQATAPSIGRLHFPADEGVQLDGWDGIVTSRDSNAFVPAGVSVWEMGVDKNPKGKADKDYEKRSQNPLGLDPKQTTFVFVTPRRWKNKGDWAKSRRAESQWANVQAYDAGDIETWLEQAPAVHLWLSMLIGKHPQGAWSLDDYWSGWIAKTDPTFSPALVIGGVRPPANESSPGCEVKRRHWPFKVNHPKRHWLFWRRSLQIRKSRSGRGGSREPLSSRMRPPGVPWRFLIRASFWCPDFKERLKVFHVR